MPQSAMINLEAMTLNSYVEEQVKAIAILRTREADDEKKQSQSG